MLSAKQSFAQKLNRIRVSGIENLFENWNDTASWTTDGSLQYDERNNVLYFDKTKFTKKLPDVSEDYDVAAVRTFEIPDGSHGFYFSVTLGNSSPLFDHNGGRIDIEYYDANGVKTVGDYITFYIYDAENFIEAYLGDDKPAPIPEDASSMVIKAYGFSNTKTIEFYMKDFKLSFSDSEDCMETFGNVYPTFFGRKVDESPIRISAQSQVVTVVSFAGIIVGVAVVAILLARADRRRRKMRK